MRIRDWSSECALPIYSDAPCVCSGVSMTKSFPLLPLRDIVVFPQMIVPLFVGRDKSVVALEKAMEADKDIFLVAQLDPAEDDPGPDSLYVMAIGRASVGDRVFEYV